MDILALLIVLVVSLLVALAGARAFLLVVCFLIGHSHSLFQAVQADLAERERSTSSSLGGRS
jgi:hypothetical protein